MLYVICFVISAGYVTFPIRFWLAVRRLGGLTPNRPLSAADGHVFALDMVSVSLPLNVAYWAAHDWYGFTLPFFSSVGGAASSFMAIACTVACLGIGVVNCRQRFDDATRAGMPEAALRWAIARQIITAAEVAHALRAGRIQA